MAAILFFACAVFAQDARKGSIAIDCERIDATVFLDGKKLVGPPVPVQTVSAGNHQLVVVAPDAEVFVETVKVEPGMTTQVAVKLSDLSGGIAVNTDPPGAMVAIDGRDVGESPVEIKNASRGKHVISARMRGFVQREKEVDLKYGEELSVFLRMRKKEAVFSVFSFPSGADVFLDGKKVGVTPLKLKQFTPGTYKLKVLREKGFEHEQEITLTAGRDLAVDVTLPIPGAILVLDVGPEGRKLFIDGREYSTVNSPEISAPPGKHLVEVRGWKGTTLFSRHMTLEKGEAYPLDFKPSMELQAGCELQGHEKELLALAFSPDGKRIASASKSGELILWDISSRKSVLKLNAHDDGIASISFSPDGKLIATGGWDGYVKILDAMTGKEKRSLEVKKSVSTVAWSPDGSKVAAGCAGGVVFLWDVAKEWKSSSLIGHVDTVRALSFDSAGKSLVTGGAGGRIIIWNTADATEIEKFADSSPVNGVIFSRSDEYVISGCEDGRTRIRKPGDSGVLALIKAQPHWVSNLVPAWGAVFAVGGDGETVSLLDADARKPILEIEGMKASATAIAFDGAGRQLAVGSRGGVIQFWLAQ